MFKAVFIDIDGTLLKSDHTISSATVSSISKLKEKNILVVLVSARPLHGMTAIAGEIGLQHFPLAGLNGACISLGKKIIFESIIDIPTVIELHEQLLQRIATPIFYQQMKWFAEIRNTYTDHEQMITKVPIIVQPFKETLLYWKEKNDGPGKILAIADARVTNELQYDLNIKFGDRLNIYTSKPTYLEVMNIAASKVNAVKFIIERYGIQPEEVIAIGDNFNDKDMIAFAGTGVAMGNAPDEVKKAADYVTDTNNNEGVSKAVSRFFDV
jgi:Cof subfamily protein (haloacid dehalogenase superfamily)